MDKVYLERPSVSEVLATKIRSYKREHQRLSNVQIARKLGIGSSQFHRLEMGDTAKPSVELAVKVMKGLGSTEELADFIRTYYPDLHEGLFDYFVNSQAVEDDGIGKYFLDESTYLMMLHASSSAGLCEKYVLQEFGRTGHAKFMKLAAKGTIHNVNGRFFTKDKSTILTSYQTTKIAEFVNKRNAEEFNTFGELKSGLSNVVYESVNLDKISKQLKNLTEDYLFEVKSLILSPENRGESMIVFTNTITKL